MIPNDHSVKAQIWRDTKYVFHGLRKELLRLMNQDQRHILDSLHFSWVWKELLNLINKEQWHILDTASLLVMLSFSKCCVVLMLKEMDCFGLVWTNCLGWWVSAGLNPKLMGTSITCGYVFEIQTFSFKKAFYWFLSEGPHDVTTSISCTFNVGRQSKKERTT